MVHSGAVFVTFRQSQASCFPQFSSFKLSQVIWPLGFIPNRLVSHSLSCPVLESDMIKSLLLVSANGINWSEEHLGNYQQLVWPQSCACVWSHASRMITEEMGDWRGGGGDCTRVSGSRAGGNSYVTQLMSDHHVRWDPAQHPCC